MPSPQEFMQRALVLAARGAGWTSPNPLVGALLTRNGQILSEGWHARFGAEHAEAMALRLAGDRARGATLYVTLEPCCHQGKTPPCTSAILHAGIRTVVFGASDPHPAAAGGARLLREAGVEVIPGVLQAECAEQNAPFFKRLATGLPLCSAKWAMSLDGKIATQRGDSRWITAPQARARAHQLRAAHDAVLVGIGTVLRDAPRLTVRDPASDHPWNGWQPWRVILDSHARTPAKGSLWETPDAGPLLILVTQHALQDRVERLQEAGATVLRLKTDQAQLPLEEALRCLAGQGIQSLLVEGGSQVLGSFIDQQLVDRVYVFIAPRILGGARAVPAVGGLGVETVAQALPLRHVRQHQLGDDQLLEGRLGSWPWAEGLRS